MNLSGKVIELNKLGATEKKEMFVLMDLFYDNVSNSVFLKDLAEKDYCILLHDDQGAIKGFSSQKMISLKLNNQTINGVFSGDTIIHKDYWGSIELYKVFGKYFIEYGSQFKDFYWFLISKGYKTYKMLPLFFNAFYPNYKLETPDFEKSIMDAFGNAKYPEEYDKVRGVVAYKGVKDKLKEGVADITDKHLKDRNIDFFVKSNPGYSVGNDLVCLARLTEDNLKDITKRMVLGRHSHQLRMTQSNDKNIS